MAKKKSSSKKSAPARRRSAAPETAESMARKQREISVSEFFLKNRHLLGFDSPRKALMTTVKEAVDNSLDACEEAGILPEISVEIVQTAADRFTVSVTDNGPGIVKAQIPKIFAKLLYGSKFHRLRMSRGQQGIGISAAGMYGQLTTGKSTHILSKIKGKKRAQAMSVQIDARGNQPTTIREEEVDWAPTFYPTEGDKQGTPVTYKHGTNVSIEMEATYMRGKLSVDEYLKQCAIVNPHLELHYRVRTLIKDNAQKGKRAKPALTEPLWTTYFRAVRKMPESPTEIKPHPHGVELGMLIQMLKDTSARTLRSALSQDFSRVSSNVALKICQAARLNPQARPTRIAHKESEALYRALGETKLMRPATDCLSPIGEDQIIAGLEKEIEADYYIARTRDPTVYRGNPFQVEVGLAYCPGGNREENIGQEEPARVMRFANRVPLLYMSGACAMTRAMTQVNWKAYGLQQPKNGAPLGPLVIMMHMASVWVPFTSESKEAVAHYQEIIREFAFALQDCGRQLSIYLNKRKRAAEAERKRNYIELYIPHLALGLKEILGLTDRQEDMTIKKLKGMLEKSKLEA